MLDKDKVTDIELINHIREVEELNNSRQISNVVSDSFNRCELCHPISYNYFPNSNNIWSGTSFGNVNYNSLDDIFTFHRDSGSDYLIAFDTLELDPNTTYMLYFNVIENSMTNDFRSISSSSFLVGNFVIPAGQTGEFYAYFSSGSTQSVYDLWLYCRSNGTLKANIMLLKGNVLNSYVPYEGCLYGLELYDMIESNFITNNYYVNCGVIATFLMIVVLIVNSPFWFIRKIKGD